jgi:hypothetical protein
VGSLPIPHTIQAQQNGNLGQRETRQLGALDASQALERLGPVIPEPPERARWLGQKSAALVIADRLDSDAGSFGERTDGQLR